MHSIIPFVAFLSLISRSLAANCKAVTSSCTDYSATHYCSKYLKIMPHKTFTTSTQSTYTYSTYSLTTVSTDSCPTHGPGGFKKRDELAALRERAPEPTPAPEAIDWAAAQALDLERRALGNVPKCLRQYTSDDLVSSACGCFSDPITTSLETVTKRTLLSNAPTSTYYTDTITITSLLATPTCGVSTTDPSSGKTINFKPIYQVCNSFRIGATTPYGDEYYPPKTTLCSALQQCAAFFLTQPQASTFDLTYVYRDGTDGPKVWWCRPYSSVTDPPLEFYGTSTDVWFEGFGYQPVS